MKPNEIIENRLAQLKTVKPVDAPPFLYTRVLARIRSIEPEQVAPKWVWATVAGLAAMLVINAAVLTKSVQRSPGEVQNVINALQLNSSNDFYQ